MSTTITGEDTFTSPVPIPVIGDKTYTTVVPQMAQALANSAQHHENLLKGIYTPEELAPEDLDTEEANVQVPPFGVYGHTPLRTAARTLYSNLKVIQTALQSSISSLTASVSSITPRVWGLGLTQDWVFAPQAMFGNTSDTDAAYWYQSDRNAFPPYIGQGTIASSPTLIIPVPPLPKNSTISYAKILVKARLSHGSIAGMTMPTLGLYKMSGAGTTTLMGSASDGSGSAASYQAFHGIQAYCTPIQVQAGYSYYLLLSGESSTNALDDSFAVYQCAIGLS